MISYAKKTQRKLGLYNCIFDIADHRNIPMPDNSCDIVIIGWALVGFINDRIDKEWELELDKIILECKRILKNDGTIIIFETVNILNELPFGKIFHPVRKMFLKHIEQKHGFKKHFYHNDWDFKSIKNIKKIKFWSKKLYKMILSSG